MRLPLDTRAFLRTIADDLRLAPGSRKRLPTGASPVMLSELSFGEIASKHALARSECSRRGRSVNRSPFGARMGRSRPLATSRGMRGAAGIPDANRSCSASQPF